MPIGFGLQIAPFCTVRHAIDDGKRNQDRHELRTLLRQARIGCRIIGRNRVDIAGELPDIDLRTAGMLAQKLRRIEI